MPVAPAPSGPLEKFAFDTVFDNGGQVASSVPRPKRSYTADEVEAIRRAANADGDRLAMASIAAREAAALEAIAQACRQALPRLAQVAHEHRVGSAELALACARAIAAAALDQFPQAPVRAALEALAREIDAAPRLVVVADPELAEGLQAALEDTAQAVGYGGAIQVRPSAEAAPGAFTLDFGDGSASFDPQAAAERVTQALHAALAAEGLHAEPLIPGDAGDPMTPES
ncbi:MAG: flagellar assembly protein FliH [Phenylobacterium sp.]